VREPYVSAVVEAFLTNGNGVAWAADEHYTAMISRFGPLEAVMAELMHVLPSKVTRPAASDLVDAIQSFSADPEKIAIDAGLKRLADRLRTAVAATNAS